MAALQAANSVACQNNQQVLHSASCELWVWIYI